MSSSTQWHSSCARHLKQTPLTLSRSKAKGIRGRPYWDLLQTTPGAEAGLAGFALEPSQHLVETRRWGSNRCTGESMRFRDSRQGAAPLTGTGPTHTDALWRRAFRPLHCLGHLILYFYFSHIRCWSCRSSFFIEMSFIFNTSREKITLFL